MKPQKLVDGMPIFAQTRWVGSWLQRRSPRVSPAQLASAGCTVTRLGAAADRPATPAAEAPAPIVNAVVAPMHSNASSVPAAASLTVLRLTHRVLLLVLLLLLPPLPALMLPPVLLPGYRVAAVSNDCRDTIVLLSAMPAGVEYRSLTVRGRSGPDAVI